MKLGLLLLLAVAVLVAGLSEARIVSKCELREKLGTALVLPRRLERYRERIAEIVICNANFRTRLNTGFVKVFGRRKTTTAKPTTTTPMTTTPTTTTPRTTTPMTTTSTTTTPRTTTPTTTTPTTTTPRTTTPMTTTPTTTTPTTTTPRTTTPMTTTPVTTKPTTTQQTTTQRTTTQPATTQPMTAQPKTMQPTTRSIQTSVEAGRQKREAVSSSEESDMSGMDLQEMLNEEGDSFDEEEMKQDDNEMDDGYEDKESDDEEEEEQEVEEGGKRKKRSYNRRKHPGVRRYRYRVRKPRPWSLGFYGIFRLSDSHFCNSGYRWSRNLCRTNCQAFTDDDITDEINCVVRTHFWQFLLRTAPRWCYKTTNYFRKCK